MLLAIFFYIFRLDGDRDRITMVFMSVMYTFQRLQLPYCKRCSNYKLSIRSTKLIKTSLLYIFW